MTTLEHPTKTPNLNQKQARARWQRLDTAQILKRLFFCERSLVITASAWLPRIAPLEIKTDLPRLNWQISQAANALRERVFELRYPSRLLENNDEAPLVAVFDGLRNAPSEADFLDGLALLLEILREAYADYLDLADAIADGPTIRFMEQSRREKDDQIAQIRAWRAEFYPDAHSSWPQKISAAWQAQNGFFESPAPGQIVPTAPAIEIPDVPARDSRFWPCRFYWPDVVDKDFPYGEGAALQMRSAISHLNEVWAVETGGVMLAAFADVLPFEWIADAARWTYDEARHCRMGYDRLMVWGFSPSELPLGSYIYDSAAGQDPIYRIGMLFFFETKNIKNKPKRAESFADIGDATSQHDMEFDWADETMHAGYGKKWLSEILKARGADPNAYDEVRQKCGELVEANVKTATLDEIAALKTRAAALLEAAQRESADNETVAGAI